MFGRPTVIAAYYSRNTKPVRFERVKTGWLSKAKIRTGNDEVRGTTTIPLTDMTTPIQGLEISVSRRGWFTLKGTKNTTTHHLDRNVPRGRLAHGSVLSIEKGSVRLLFDVTGQHAKMTPRELIAAMDNAMKPRNKRD